MKWKTCAFLASAASVLIASNAVAQDAGAPQAAPADQPAADATQGDAGGLGEIIVTAQRRSESIQNVPISITAASADTLASARVENISNIQAISPSISFRVTNIASSSANVIIRGMGTTGNSRSFEGSVGVFIDGVYRSRAASALQNFLDIDNLQVLRGPQGTLFGKNTTAGALLLTSATPTFEKVEGLVDLSVANYDNVMARAAVSLPVSDTLSVRVAGMASTRDGFFTFPDSSRRLNGDSSQAVKAQVRFEPSADFSLRLIGDYSKSAGACCYGTANYVDGPTQPLIDALTRANGLKVPSKNLGLFQATLSSDSRQNIKDYGGTALMTIGLGGGELHSVTALRQFNVSQTKADADFSGAALLDYLETFDSRFFSQELTYNRKIEALNADVVIGAFFSDEKLKMYRDLAWGSQAQTYWDTVLAASGLPAGTGEAAEGRVATEVMRGRAKSYAGFAHADFALGTKFNVIAGIRYSVEEKQGAFAYNFYDPAPNAVFKVLGVSPGPGYDRSITNRAVSGTFGIQYRPFDHAMLYATYNRGFKAGGVNIDANAAGTYANNPSRGGVPLDPSYKPEKVNAYEVGAKIDYFDRRARTNIALFYYDISDVQIAQFVGLQFAVLNARSAQDYGLEFENLFQVTPAITIGLDGTWIPRARYDVDANIDPVLSGSRFRFAPKFQGNATVNLDQPLTDSLNLIGRVQYQYTGAQFANTASLSRRPSVGLLDANLGLKLQQGMTIEAWGQNLTNEVYPTQLFNTPFQTGDQNAYLGAPRTYGVRLRARF